LIFFSGRDPVAGYLMVQTLNYRQGDACGHAWVEHNIENISEIAGSFR
jgi:hypothetical protein